jgi:DNA-binding transcriptional ArsR family regulator
MQENDCLDIFKALADRSRLRLIKALRSSTLSVNELTEKLGMSQYNTSRHLRVLKQAGIVDVIPQGTRREYFIAKPLRDRLEKEGNQLNFGCCTLDFDKLPD